MNINMKKILGFVFLIATALLLQPIQVKAQADTIMQICTSYLPSPYISDGQQYKALLSEDEVAEFKVTFFGGSTYRIAACSGLSAGSLIFTVYDKDRNELFSNRDYQNSPYWDFDFKSTVDCVIEAQLDNRVSSSGFAILLIGFKP